MRAFNPHIEDLPDPTVLIRPQGYFIYSTNTPKVNVPVIFSTDLVDYVFLGDALPSLPRWAEKGLTWAPDVAELAGSFVLYFTARLKGSGKQVIGVAVADHPQGPFVATSRPLVSSLLQGGAIDPNVLRTQDGRQFLYWKNDGNAVGQPTYLWGAELSSDGLNLISSPQILLSATEDWERGLVEAPQVIEEQGVFHLLYSCADYGNESYAVGHAWSASPLGAFEKTRQAPVLASSGRVAGPGHSHAFRTQHGWRLAYHAWEQGNCGYPRGRRALHLAELRVQGRGVEIS